GRTAGAKGPGTNAKTKGGRRPQTIWRQSEAMNPSESQTESIAIIGLAGRFPGAKNLAEFWRNLRDGVETVSFFQDEELQASLLANLVPHRDLIGLVGGFQIMLASDKDYLPTRVSYKLNLRGPSLTVQTACSTSLVAVCLACQNLLNYQCDMALAGGVSITFPQKKGLLYQEGGIISPDGHCRAFDADAGGTVSGDGVGIVV